ncbi:tetratricopeptide repeat protein [Bradyrhizobium sp. URHD0069]|uniref:tetratricopeptide repeat protein n=1 Tax=Bradyrhizobium sp. URHD0069 TaxID=1380355 RepID=UPI00210FFAD7|nr:tetratricopeptide repeat protein [Bradyrhizobium sp. URHD0069]
MCAAEQGFAPGELNLGRMYDNGQGAPQDYAEAVKWIRKAAKQGDAEAQSHLGAMYAQGHGVQRDYIRAYTWFNLAAMAGSQRAVNNRDIAAKHMTPDEIAEAQKLARESQTNKQLPR